MNRPPGWTRADDVEDDLLFRLGLYVGCALAWGDKSDRDRRLGVDLEHVAYADMREREARASAARIGRAVVRARQIAGSFGTEDAT